MSAAVDIVARGLALKAANAVSPTVGSAPSPAIFLDLAGADIPHEFERVESSGHSATGRGAGSYAHDALCNATLLANHPRFAFQASDNRIFRLLPTSGVLEADQGGALGDGISNDLPAISDTLAYAAEIGVGTVLLGSVTYAISGANGVSWNHSALTLAGQGMRATVLRQVDHSLNSGAAITMGSCSDVTFRDLTLHGADNYATFYVPQGAVTERIRFDRVRFTNDPQATTDSRWFSSTNGVRWVVDTGSVRDVTFADCVFENCGRMGVEFQNHGAGSVVRYSDISLIRPRLINIGQPNASAGYTAGIGISLSGYGENVLVDAPYFDNIDRICIEMVGCSRSTFRDIRVRYDTMGVALIEATNNRPMYGNLIDGLRFTGPEGQDILAAPPAIAAGLRLDNWHDGTVRNCQVNSNGIRALRLGTNYASTKNLVEANLLICDGAKVIDNLQCEGNRFVGNRIVSSYAGATSGLVGVYGNFSTDLYFDANVFEADSSPSWQPLNFTGTATARFSNGNLLKGKAMAASGTFLLASGTSYVGVDHGLGVTPARYGVVPKSRVYDGGGDRTHWSGVGSNIINVQTANNVSADVTFHWWAEAEFGNI